ncbi:hypothetical protein RJ640_029823 [Escallonia rubra]|uniref:Sulfotransferase n=1 Tax=Escallonia rubra TaxID=112253 RepID=A0AA88QUH8_9ASTE|nr:hypothetical protein RJ640_029823 [Escallonia rubra]
MKREEEAEDLSPESKVFLLSLPKEKGWRTRYLYQYQGQWCQAKQTLAIVSFQKHFQAEASDIMVATVPRSGTIWLKALVFAIVNRQRFGVSDDHHPLLTSDPHVLVASLDYKLYQNDILPDLSDFSRPRLFATHVAYPLLPESVKSSDCRIVHICRNPLDNFVSLWHLQVKLRPEALGPLSLEEAFDMYCRGAVPYGPYWEHMLGYWKMSLERPQKVFFVKYEDMKEDTILHVKRLAEFVGFPFSVDEEREGVIEEISKLCSFQTLRKSEVNRPPEKATANALMRKGEVGDWVNHLTPSMVDQLSNIMAEKLHGSGLTFKLSQ